MKTLSNTFGIVFLILGIMGFIPWMKDDGRLLGTFAADAANNIFYIITGLAALWAGTLSAHAARNFFRIFGAIYLGLAIIGFLNEGYILGVLAHTGADDGLHLVAGGLAILFGFAPRNIAVRGTTPSSP